MSNITRLKTSRNHARNMQNNMVFADNETFLKTIQTVIKLGLSIKKYSIESKKIPLIEIQHCKRCKTLKGAPYIYANDEKGAYKVWQRMMNGCRVEWTTRPGEVK